MIKIYTVVSNRPDLLELQVHSFKKYLAEDFEFVVFNNAKFDCAENANYDGIQEACVRSGVQAIDVQKDDQLLNACQDIEPSCRLLNVEGRYSNANVAHAYALCWAWKNIISKQTTPVAIVDSDIFLTEKTVLTDTLYPHQMCNIPDGKPHPDGPVMYMWPTFFMADIPRLPEPETLNWWCGRIKNVPVDVGGQTYHYFQAHPELGIHHIARKHFVDSNECPSNYDEFYMKNGEVVIHYRSGSNWNHRSSDYHRNKTVWLRSKIG